MDLYLLINIIFILFCILYACLEKIIKSSQSKYIVACFVVVFAIIAAARPLETRDTAGYVNGFFYIQPDRDYGITILQKYQGYELGYIWLVQFFKQFSNNYRIFFFIIALVGTAIAIKSLQSVYLRIVPNDKNSLGAISAVYFASFGLLYNAVSVRAGLAMSLCLMAIDLIEKKKKIRALLSFLIAFLFQRTVAVFVVIFLAIKIMPHFGKKIHFIIWAILGCLLVFVNSTTVLDGFTVIVNDLVEQYSINGVASYLTEFDTAVGLRDYFQWLLYGYFIFFQKKDSWYSKLLNVIMVGMVFVVFFHGIRAFSRVSDMFFLYTVPLLVSIWVNSGRKENTVNWLLCTCIWVVNAYLMLARVFAV